MFRFILGSGSEVSYTIHVWLVHALVYECVHFNVHPLIPLGSNNA